MVIRTYEQPTALNPQSRPQTTEDFDRMIKIVFFNSFGFFFFTFLILYIPANFFYASGRQIGLIFTSSVLGNLISSIIIGFLSDNDKFNKKLLVSIGSIGRALSLILIYLAIGFKSLVLFTTGIFFQGFIVIFFWNPLDILIAEKSDENYRTIAYGKKSKLIGIGSLIGSIISFTIFSFFTYLLPSNVWLIFSPLIIFAFFNIYAGLRFNKEVTKNSISNILKNKTQGNRDDKDNGRTLIGFVLLLIVIFAMSVNVSIGAPFYQAYLIENIIQNPLIVMLIYLPAYIFAQILAPTIGKYTQRLNIFVSITLISSFGAFATWLIISTTSGLVFSTILLFDSLFSTAGQLITKDYSSKLSAEHRGKIFASIKIVTYTGGIIAPIIGGILWENISHKMPFIVSIFTEFLLIIPYLLAIYLLLPEINKKKN